MQRPRHMGHLPASAGLMQCLDQAFASKGDPRRTKGRLSICETPYTKTAGSMDLPSVTLEDLPKIIKCILLFTPKQ